MPHFCKTGKNPTEEMKIILKYCSTSKNLAKYILVLTGFYSMQKTSFKLLHLYPARIKTAGFLNIEQPPTLTRLLYFWTSIFTKLPSAYSENPKFILPLLNS